MCSGLSVERVRRNSAYVPRRQSFDEFPVTWHVPLVRERRLTLTYSSPISLISTGKTFRCTRNRRRYSCSGGRSSLASCEVADGDRFCTSAAHRRKVARNAMTGG